MRAGVSIAEPSGLATFALLADFGRAFHTRRKASLPTGQGPSANMPIAEPSGLPTAYFVSVLRKTFNLPASEALGQQQIVGPDGAPTAYFLGRWTKWTS